MIAPCRITTPSRILISTVLAVMIGTVFYWAMPLFGQEEPPVPEPPSQSDTVEPEEPADEIDFIEKDIEARRKTAMESLDALTSLPPAAGWIILLASLLPLLLGWKLVRAFHMVLFSIALMGIATALVVPAYGLAAGLIVGVVVCILGGVIGRYLRNVQGAVIGAIVCGALFAVPGALLENWVLLAGLGAAGGIIGLVLGWKAAPYVDAVATSFFGGIVATVGAIIAARNMGEKATSIIAVGTLFVSFLIGVVYQFCSIAKQGRPVSAPMGWRREELRNIQENDND